MYGYKLKHEILGAYVSYEIDRNKQGLPSDQMTITQMGSMLGKYRLKVAEFAPIILYLHIEGYFSLQENLNEPRGINNDSTITITNKGRSAYFGNYFKEKNDEIRFGRIEKITMICLNAIVAVAAALALYFNSDSNVSNLSDRITFLEKQIMNATRISPPIINQEQVIDTAKQRENDTILNSRKTK